MKIFVIHILLLLAAIINTSGTVWLPNNYLAYYKNILLLKESAPPEKFSANMPLERVPQLIYLMDKQLFFKTFFTDAPLLIAEYKSTNANSIKMLEQNVIESEWYYFVLAELHSQRSLILVNNGDLISAAMELRKAFKLASKNKAIYPSFSLNNKVMGLLHCAIGAIPPNYNWLKDLSGMEGSLEQGLLELLDCIKKNKGTPHQLFEEEILFTITNIWNLSASDSNQFGIIQNYLTPLASQSKLMQYCLLTLQLKNGKGIHALSTANIKSVPPTDVPLYLFDYRAGLALLYNLDNTATAPFLNFLKNYQGKNLIKAAYQKLAWISLIHNDTKAYHYYISQCLVKGNDLLDDDKQAAEEAKRKVIPNVNLLKARLLFDGGYYDQALEILVQTLPLQLRHGNDSLEYHYRLARCYLKTNQVERSALLFRKVMDTGQQSSLHYAPNAALNLGQIYETQGNLLLAKKYFEKCLQMKNHDYENSIHQKAKAALKRLANR